MRNLLMLYKGKLVFRNVWLRACCSSLCLRMRPSSAVSSRPSSSRSQLESSLVKSCTSLKSLRAENERYQWVGLDVVSKMSAN